MTSRACARGISSATPERNAATGSHGVPAGWRSKRRTDQLMLLFADRVVEEDHKLVPAVSKAMLLRFYQGAAQYDLIREHDEGDLDPSPPPMSNGRG